MVAIPARVAIPIAKVKTYLLLDLESIAVIVLCPLSGINPNILDEMRFGRPTGCREPKRKQIVVQSRSGRLATAETFSASSVPRQRTDVK